MRHEFIALVNALKRVQLVTSVLVAYELYRGVHPESSTRKSQIKELELTLARFSLKPVHEAIAMQAAKAFSIQPGRLTRYWPLSALMVGSPW
jgi:predicted nucleic acid-binding protein